MRLAAHRAAWTIAAAVTASPLPAIAAESRAEVQINLCSPSDQVQRALELKAARRKATVWLFDTDDLTLHHSGLRLRLRERGARAELTLKADGQDCRALDPALLAAGDKCEADLHGDTLEDVVSLGRTINATERASLTAAANARGRTLARALAAVLTPAQRSQLVALRPGSAEAPVPMEIVRLGPSTVLSLTSKSQPFGVEIWLLPGGQQFIELSQKVERAVALKRRDELLGYLAARAVTVCADQASQAENKFEALIR
jgi:hypothetical protein